MAKMTSRQLRVQIEEVLRMTSEKGPELARLEQEAETAVGAIESFPALEISLILAKALEARALVEGLQQRFQAYEAALCVIEAQEKAEEQKSQKVSKSEPPGEFSGVA